MLKTFAMIVRRADIDRDEFRRHYEEIHSPLALPLLEGLIRYVKYHLVDDLYGEAGFDVITGFWYSGVEAAMGTMQRVEAPEGAAIRADELTFMDKPRNTFFAVAEQSKIEGDAGLEGSLQTFVLVKAPENEGDRYLKAFDERASAVLLDLFTAPTFALAHTVLGAGEPTAFDRVMQIRADAVPDREALAAWAAGEQAQGAQVLAVQTRTYETLTPWSLNT